EQNAGTGEVPLVTDARRISYWFTPNEGLFKEEGIYITADPAEGGFGSNNGVIDPSALPPNNLADDPEKYLLADEVQSALFEYFEGSEWVEEWDSTDTTASADGVTPKGSPRAIRVTLELAQPDKPDRPVRTFVHTIALPTANGTNPLTQINPPANPPAQG